MLITVICFLRDVRLAILDYRLQNQTIYIMPASIESNKNHTSLYIPLINTLLTQNFFLMTKNKLFVFCWWHSSYAMKKKQPMKTYVLAEKVIYSISTMFETCEIAPSAISRAFFWSSAAFQKSMCLRANIDFSSSSAGSKTLI